MKFKALIVTVLLILGIPLAATAETKKSHSPEPVACKAKCSQLQVAQTNTFTIVSDNPNSELAQLDPSDGNQTLTQRGYAGGTLGVFFVSELDGVEIAAQDFDIDTIDFDTGYGGSLYAGYRFSHILATDVELYLFGGNAKPEDSNFSSVGFFLNPRFVLPFGSNSLKAPFLFASPGVGIVGISFGDEIEQLIEDTNTAFAFQIKAGGGLPLSESLDVIGQVRYVNAFGLYPQNDNEDGDLSTVGLEAGLNFKF
ncbi:MAG: outer membrane beta-barrel protein [Waterburya sp.]